MDRISTFQALQISIRINQTNFLSTWSNWSTPHHLDKHKMKRSKPYESCFLDKTSPLDPRNVPSHNYQQWQQQTTLQHCVAVCHLRVWSRITGGHSTGSPSPTPIFAMSILNSHFVFVHFAVSTVLFPLTVISNYLYIATPSLSLFSHLSFLSNYLQWYHLYSHIFRCIPLPFLYSISSILIQIFRQLLSRSICHSLDSFFNGPSSACFLVFSLVNFYLFLWDRTLGPKRRRP